VTKALVAMSQARLTVRPGLGSGGAAQKLGGLTDTVAKGFGTEAVRNQSRREATRPMRFAAVGARNKAPKR